jgi:DNA-binding NtrC family response regulator
VRELRNVLERGLVLAGGGVVDIDHLPIEIQDAQVLQPTGPDRFGERVESYKKEILLEALHEANWIKKDAAKALGMTQRALSHYVLKYGLDKYREESSA